MKMKLAVALLNARSWIAWRLLHLAAAIQDEYVVVMSSRGKSVKQRWKFQRYPR